MIIKFIDSYVEKYGYIRRAKVQDILSAAREAERKAVSEDYDRLLEQTERDLNEKHFLELSGRDSEIKRLNQRLESAHTQLDNARKAYNSYKKDLQNINSLISDVVFNIKKIFDRSGEIYQSFAQIQTEAEGYITNLNEHDEENKRLLGMRS